MPGKVNEPINKEAYVSNFIDNTPPEVQILETQPTDT